MSRARSARIRSRPALELLEARDLPSFLPPARYPTGDFPYDPVVADLNGDGHLDVAVTVSQEHKLAVLLGDGTGALGATTTYPTGTLPYGLRVGDVNLDGKPDLVSANSIANTVSVLLGRGDGTFKPKIDFATGETPVRV